jgi:AraC-like DNA-binding protein
VTMRVSPNDPSRGILDLSEGLRRFTLNRYDPAPDLRAWIESYWVVTWELPPGVAHRQVNIAHAGINVAFEPEGSFLYGAIGRLFEREISGTGRAFGIKFRPGGFFPFFTRSLRPLTGKVLPAAAALGDESRDWVVDMETRTVDREQVDLSNQHWLTRARTLADPGSPARATLIADRIISDHAIITVAAAAAAAGMTVRALERLFYREVGLGPKEVICRYRLQEAADRLLREPAPACGQLALEMGYFDQAHFIRDFKRVVGASPEEYRRRQRAHAAADA